MTRRTAPLFSLDPGWPYIAAGLAICAAGVIIPAQQEVLTLRLQLAQLTAQEQLTYARLEAHSKFLDEVEHPDRTLIMRLAATQLHLVPSGHKPVLLVESHQAPVLDWIDASVSLMVQPPPPPEESWLSRLSSGRSRLWLFGAGVMCLFVGLVMGPDRMMPERDTIC